MALRAQPAPFNLVALLAEGVDRNESRQQMNGKKPSSPSSRRAWIEITRGLCAGNVDEVALLAEGVDRNKSVFIVDS